MDQMRSPRTEHAPASPMIRMRQGGPLREDLAAELTELNRLVTSEPAEARERAADLQRRAEALGDRPVVAGALLCRAEGNQRSGELTAAMALISEACDLWAPLTAESQVRASLLRSFVYNDLGDESASLQQTMDAIMAFTDEVPATLRIRVMNKHADLLHVLGALDDSLLWYSRAEDLAVGDAQMHLLVANNRAYGALQDGRVEDAVAGAQQLAMLSARYRYPLTAAALDTVARIHLLAGDAPLGAKVAQDAVEASARVDFQTADAGPYYLLTLAVAERALGDLVAASATLERARKACVEEGYARCKNEILREQAEIRAELGDHRAAYAMLKEFIVEDQTLLSRQREAQARIRQTLFETVTAREEAAKYREEARRDPLTGLRNRLYAQERLSELLLDDPGPGRELSVALVDLDHFKSVNDRYSHEAGDRVLQEIGRLLETAVPTGEGAGSFAARIGGEELLLVLLTPDPAQAHLAVEELRQAVQRHNWETITPGRGITFSAGLAGQVLGDTFDTLLARADQQLYVAKSNGRNRISVRVEEVPA
jgi:diguanylate cyclase (GGDEF)-like protein